jgi:hypothetical protein
MAGHLHFSFTTSSRKANIESNLEPESLFWYNSKQEFKIYLAIEL